jgi:hypothetical protein
MSYSTWESIAETSWLVYLAISLFMLIGYTATKPRYVHLKPELTLQFLSMVMMIALTIYYVPLTIPNIHLFLACLITGSLLGWLHFQLRNIQAVKGYTAVYISGSWLSFIVIPCLIVEKYWYFGTDFHFDLNILNVPIYQHYLAGLSGLSLGLFFGRASVLLRRLRIGPYIDAPKDTLRN